MVARLRLRNSFSLSHDAAYFLFNSSMPLLIEFRPDLNSMLSRVKRICDDLLVLGRVEVAEKESEYDFPLHGLGES